MSPINKLLVASLLFALASFMTFLLVYSQQRSGQGRRSGAVVPAVTAKAIAWETSPERGFELARQTGKPLMIVFYTDWCPNCKLLDRNAFTAPAVIGESQNFVNLRINAEKRQDYAGQFGVNSYPTVVFFNPAGSVLNRFSGTHSAEEVAEKMSAARQDMLNA